MTTTGSRWKDGILQFYNTVTGETVAPAADVIFCDDFLGANGLAGMPAAGSAESGVQWTGLDVGDATNAFVADGANGLYQLHMHVTDEAEDSTLYWNDQLGLSVANGGQIEFRINMSTLPTLGTTAVAGLAGPHNLDKDTIANSAWFRWQGSGALLCESDDTTNDNDDTSTGITTVAGTYDIYRIDFTTLASVKFYVNDVRVCTSTTFDMSNLTAAEKIMQPYFSLDKASTAGLGDMVIDYVKFWGPRG
jgi:hypothetical protein